MIIGLCLIFLALSFVFPLLGHESYISTGCPDKKQKILFTMIFCTILSIIMLSGSIYLSINPIILKTYNKINRSEYTTEDVTIKSRCNILLFSFGEDCVVIERTVRSKKVTVVYDEPTTTIINR